MSLDIDRYDVVSSVRKDDETGLITDIVDGALAEHCEFSDGRDLTYFERE